MSFMTDPMKQFERWARLAQASEPNDYDAASLATSERGNLPDIRMILVRRYDARGFVFFSHQDSAKGKQLADNPNAALNFHWKSLRRQVRVRGHVAIIDTNEADLYFQQRPRDHQLNAHASKQSRVLKNRDLLAALFRHAKQKFHRETIPRPAYWVGFRLAPLEIEFWRARRSRQHDRVLFYRASVGARWRTKMLFP